MGAIWMSSFTQPLITKHLPGRLFEVAVPFEYHVGSFPSIEAISIHRGFVTDLATIPRWLWSLFPPMGNYDQAAVLHDYCYDNAINSKEWAGRVFLESLQVLGVPKWKRKTMYWFVRQFGRGNY